MRGSREEAMKNRQSRLKELTTLLLSSSSSRNAQPGEEEPACLGIVILISSCELPILVDEPLSVDRDFELDMRSYPPVEQLQIHHLCSRQHIPRFNTTHGAS